MSETAMMPPGLYFLCDPCYALRDDLQDAFYGFCDESVNKIEILGYPVLGMRTAFGDGLFCDQKGQQYGVDSGMLGLVPVALSKTMSNFMGFGKCVTFRKPTKCSRSEDGTLKFGSIKIETSGAP